MSPISVLPLPAQVLRGCTPVYSPGSCCPQDWICPHDESLPVGPPGMPGTTRDPIAQSSPAPALRSLPVGPPGMPGTPIKTASKPADACLLPAEIGRCRMLKVQHFFDAARGVCATFGWGGCGGNGNRFGTLEACQTTCREHMLAIPRSLPAPTPPSAKVGLEEAH